MSNVPKLRFSEFGGEWKKDTFKKLVKLQRGSSPRPIIKYVTKSDDGVNWIKIGDTKSNDTYINFTEEKITKEGALKSRKVSIGDIILSNSMSYGKPYILNINGYIHDGWFVIKEYEKCFHKSYLYQILRSEWIQKQYKRLAAGGVVSNISSELVNAVKVNLPSKQEQEKIASFLTSVDTRIEQLTKKEELLEKYKKVVMQKIFNQVIRFKDENGNDFDDWNILTLKNLVNIKTGKKDVNESNINGKYPFFSCAKQHTYSDTFSYDFEAILIAGNGEVGECKYYNGKFEAYQRTYILNNFKINSQYLFQYIKSLFSNEAKKQKQQGAMPYIKLGTLETFKIKHPINEKEQEKIANFLTEIDKKIENTKKEIENTKIFKKALLQQMFI